MTEFDNVLLATEVIPFDPMLALADLGGEATLSASAIPQLSPSADLILQDHAGSEDGNWIVLLHSTASAEALASGNVSAGHDAALLVNPIANPEEEEEQVITITGYGGGGGGTAGGGGSGGGSSGGGDAGGGGYGDGGTGGTDPTPCVETALSNGTSTDAANKAAAEAARKIAERNDETYEYSSIVWALAGVVGHTEPYTDRLTGQVNWLGGIAEVPNGAVIIGIVHNHPDIGDITDGIPSLTSEGGKDWQGYDQLRNWGGTRGITVDQNLLLYIYTNEDHKTRVYDRTDKETEQPSCAL